MKKNIIVVLFLLLIFQGVAHSANIKNSKQILLEYEQKNNIDNFIKLNKDDIYLMLFYEDYITTTNPNNKRNSIGRDIKTNIEQYKNKPKSNNYIYAVKAEKLYYGIANYLSKQETTKPQKIDISDSIIDKLDKNLVNNLILLNVIAEKI